MPNPLQYGKRPPLSFFFLNQIDWVAQKLLLNFFMGLKPYPQPKWVDPSFIKSETLTLTMHHHHRHFPSNHFMQWPQKSIAQQAATTYKGRYSPNPQAAREGQPPLSMAAHKGC
jgi:hypothetical protein